MISGLFKFLPLQAGFSKAAYIAVLFMLCCAGLTACKFFSINSDSGRPNIVLIIVDTLSAKHLSIYNRKLDHSPNLQALAEAGLVFEKAYSPAPWTKPAIASILTGVYPRQHSVISIDSQLPASQLTLAEVLHEQGYATHAVVSHTLLERGNGYEQGFDSFERVPLKGNVHEAITSKVVSDLGMRKVKQTQSGSERKPFFLWLHYFDPHFNYQHHAEFDRSSWYHGKLKAGAGFRDLQAALPTMTAEDARYLVDLYHEEIAYTDKHIGRLLEFIKAQGLSDNTLVIVTADHGEEFLEHGGIGHTRTLYDELINVPLLLYWPGKIKPARQAEAVSTIDLFPSILTLIQSALPANLAGASFFKDGNVQVSGERDLFSEVKFKSHAIDAHKSGLISGSNKLIQDYLAGNFSQFDFLKDPEEKTDLYSSSSAISQGMKGRLENFCSVENAQGGPDIQHSSEEIKQLESLGYL